MGKDITEQVKLEHDIAQSQKLESIGQLAAGIAHEINTPTQFVGDNTMFLNESFIDVLHVLRQSGSACRRAGRRLFAGSHRCLRGCQRAGRLYLSAVRDPQAIFQSLDGIARVGSIVQAMKEFAHPGTHEKTAVNLNDAIMSTITVASNEWKYVAEMQTRLDQSLPPVPCLVGEFNQVMLNIIVNAAHAIANVVKRSGAKGIITVSRE